MRNQRDELNQVVHFNCNFGVKNFCDIFIRRGGKILQFEEVRNYKNVPTERRN